LLRQIFTPPYVLEKGQTQPLLFAEHLRAEPLSDPKRAAYSTSVRGDLVFSDGTPLTAAIAASSLSKTAVVADVADVRADGDRVVFLLRSPNRSFELLLTQTWCEVVLERGGELLGTGPFMFEKGTTLRSVLSARSVRLVRNPHYRGQVSMDSIVFTVYPPDADGRPTKLIEACSRGEVDFTTGITSAEAAKLLEVTEGALYASIKEARDGNRTGDMAHALQEYVEGHGFNVVREYVSHGVGRRLHEDPQITNYGDAGSGSKLRQGMTIAVEPMVLVGSYKTKVLPDQWTVAAKDGKLTAHFEHTIAVTDGEAEILTKLN
jgi:hypothetical protein